MNKDMGPSFFCPYKDRTDYCDKSSCGWWSAQAGKCGVSAIADYLSNMVEEEESKDEVRR